MHVLLSTVNIEYCEHKGSSSVMLYVHRDHKDYYSIRDGEPRMATSIFTQLLSSENIKGDTGTHSSAPDFELLLSS